jgi:fermentation-respiration switch protein FrsA (DUF1100 family)
VLAAWLVTDPFDSLARVAKLKAPILFLHGECDRVVPVRYSRALFNAAAEPKEGRFVPRGRTRGSRPRYGGLDGAVAFVERRLGG